MSTQNLQNEQGRSMVEMLGVLAVMGLLTIIGIAGFKMAMNKAKANSLVADMNRLVHIVVMDKFSGYSEEAIQRAVNEHNQDTAYPAEYEYRTPQVFAIKTKNAIDKTLCQQVASLGWKLPLATYLNKVKIEGTFDEDQCSDENELIWAFTNDLSACPDCPLGDFDCTPYANRECGTCDSIEYTPNNADCNNNANGQYCLEGQCVPCGPNHFWWTGGQCVECISNDWYTTPEIYKHRCLGSMYFALPALLGCYHSRGWTAANADEKSCKACPNHCFDAVDNNTCRRSEPNQRYEKDEHGNCVCKNLVNGECRCPVGQFFNNNAHCSTCDPNDWYRTTEGHKHNCLTTMFFTTAYSPNLIWGCNKSGDIADADERGCKACTNRCYLNGTCYLAGEGQAHQRVSETDGRCQE